MIVVFEQVLVLFIFGAVGFLLSKSGIVNKDHSVILSRVLVYVIMPANTLRTFSKNCTVEYITQNYVLIVASAAVVLTLAVVMHFAAKPFSRDAYQRSVYEYSLIIPNFGYMGYALTEALLGEIALLNAMMFAIPMSVYVNSKGYCMLSKKKMTPKNLVNPVMIPMILGMIIGVLGLGKYIPTFAYTFFNNASACMGPVSMLLAGIVVSEFNVVKILKEYRIYIITFLRLFIVPIALGCAISAVGFPNVAKVAVLLYGMPCGLNTVVFPKNANENCEIGAGLALVSNILACISIPIVCSIFSIGA